MTMLSGFAFAQLAEVPADMMRPLADEEKSTSPIPPLPEEARPLTAAELKRIEQEYAPFTGASDEVKKTEVLLAANRVEADETAAVVDGFVKDNKIALPDATEPAPSQPLELKPKPTDTIINCDGGLYVDLEEKNYVVYIGNVKLRNPDYQLDCTQQLQVYLKEGQKKPDEEKEKKEEGGNAFSNMNFNFDGLKKAVAYGNVIIRYKDEEGNWYQGHAERVTYNDASGEIVMSGGYPYVKDGKNIIQLQRESGTIRHLNNKTYFDGPTVTLSDDLKGQSSLKKSSK